MGVEARSQREAEYRLADSLPAGEELSVPWRKRGGRKGGEKEKGW